MTEQETGNILVLPFTREVAARLQQRKMEQREPATCRCCGLILKGHAYMYGGSACHPDTGEQCKVNYYGGFVCSRTCDYRASLELEQSMPGHAGQRHLSPGSEAHRRIERNWPE